MLPRMYSSCLRLWNEKGIGTIDCIKRGPDSSPLCQNCKYAMHTLTIFKFPSGIMSFLLDVRVHRHKKSKHCSFFLLLSPSVDAKMSGKSAAVPPSSTHALKNGSACCREIVFIFLAEPEFGWLPDYAAEWEQELEVLESIFAEGELESRSWFGL